MTINVTSILVKDQDEALAFYTKVLGFIKKREIPMEQGRWLTVVSGEDKDGVELLLAQSAFQPSLQYQKALFDAGIPALMFNTVNIDNDYERLTTLGVEFSMEPTQMGISKIAVFNDTCGNRVQLVQVL